MIVQSYRDARANIYILVTNSPNNCSQSGANFRNASINWPCPRWRLELAAKNFNFNFAPTFRGEIAVGFLWPLTILYIVPLIVLLIVARSARLSGDEFRWPWSSSLTVKENTAWKEANSNWSLARGWFIGLVLFCRLTEAGHRLDSAYVALALCECFLTWYIILKTNFYKIYYNFILKIHNLKISFLTNRPIITQFRYVNLKRRKQYFLYKN